MIKYSNKEDFFKNLRVKDKNTGFIIIKNEGFIRITLFQIQYILCISARSYIGNSIDFIRLKTKNCIHFSIQRYPRTIIEKIKSNKEIQVLDGIFKYEEGLFYILEPSDEPKSFFKEFENSSDNYIKDFFENVLLKNIED